MIFCCAPATTRPFQEACPSKVKRNVSEEPAWFVLNPQCSYRTLVVKLLATLNADCLESLRDAFVSRSACSALSLVSSSSLRIFLSFSSALVLVSSSSLRIFLSFSSALVLVSSSSLRIFLSFSSSSLRIFLSFASAWS